MWGVQSMCLVKTATCSQRRAKGLKDCPWKLK